MKSGSSQLHANGIVGNFGTIRAEKVAIAEKPTLREQRASITLAMVQTGIATGNGETFTFSIKPVPTGFRLDNRYSGGCHVNTTGAGIWPTVEKAREIAEATARHLLNGAVVTWDVE